MSAQFFRSGLGHDYEDGGTYKVLLVGDSYTHDPDHEFVDDISGDELSGTGYSRKTVTPTETWNTDPNEKEISIGDLTWADADFGTIRGKILFKEVTDDTDSPVLIYDEVENYDADGGQATNGGDVTFNESADGLATYSLGS